VHSDDEVYEWFASVVVPERETWAVEDSNRIVAVLVLKPAWIDQLTDVEHELRAQSRPCSTQGSHPPTSTGTVWPMAAADILT
jgi:hypothetical protein